jgi:hypothetical protein
MGSNDRPESGYLYDVEMDVDVAAEQGINMQTIATSELTISTDGAFVALRVVLESLDNDGMAYFRLSDDCLFMMETTGEVPVGKTVEIRVPRESLSLTSTGAVKQ